MRGFDKFQDEDTVRTYIYIYIFLCSFRGSLALLPAKLASQFPIFVTNYMHMYIYLQIRKSLTEHFSKCGVQKIRIPTDRETGNIKGLVNFNLFSNFQKVG